MLLETCNLERLITLSYGSPMVISGWGKWCLSASAVPTTKFRGSNILEKTRFLGHSIGVWWWTKWSQGGGFSSFPQPQISFNLSPPSSHSFSFVSFHFISSCYSATGVVGQHPRYSLILNIGALSHLIPRLGPSSDTCWGYF